MSLEAEKATSGHKKTRRGGYWRRVFPVAAGRRGCAQQRRVFPVPQQGELSGIRDDSFL